jgi:putative nucleotidyltransferase with HDIG domain
MFGSNPRSPRLVGWDGRRRSSRCDALFDWSSACRRRVAVRLAVVGLAAALVAGLLIDAGPPFPYRSGQTTSRDVRARVPFEVVNEAATARAREANPTADPVADHSPAGLLLHTRDEPISDAKLALLRAEHRAYVRARTPAQRFGRGVGLSLVVALLAATVTVYSVRFQPAVCERLSSVVGVCVLAVGSVILAVAMNRPPWQAGILPLTVAAMVLTIAYNPPFALLLSLCLAIVTSLTEDPALRPLLVQMGGLSAAVLTMRQIRSRSRPVEVGLIAGAAYALMSLAVGMVTEQTARFMLADAGRNLLWAAVAGFVVAGSLPVIERCFGVVTDVSLQELADHAHPLLQELRCRAPGTYNHSLTVAMLAEAAAEAIGANPLLARVGAYFHDVGKMLKPQFFVENQAGENRHDQLEPNLSTLVIVGHVKDGMALAAEYGLPQPVVEMIHQHHGTTLVEYFYREALRLHGGDKLVPEPAEFSFRYPGPKPQTREAAVLMLADAAESATRALPAPTPGAIHRLIHDLAMKRLLDGQFDESGLTLPELRAAEEVMVRGLVAVHHARIRYDTADSKAG